MSFVMLIDNLSVLDVSYGHIHYLKIDLLHLRFLHLHPQFSQDVRPVFSLALVLQLSTPLLVHPPLRQLLQHHLSHVTFPLQYGTGHH